MLISNDPLDCGYTSRQTGIDYAEALRLPASDAFLVHATFFRNSDNQTIKINSIVLTDKTNSEPFLEQRYPSLKGHCQRANSIGIKTEENEIQFRIKASNGVVKSLSMANISHSLFAHLAKISSFEFLVI